ncbi:MAG: protein-disulfide reductase DsbD domain-containing protein, partial [Betaproteobacteria bacterium]
RSRRERPLTDDKVLADWNGLAIGAFARAGSRLAEPRYLDAARRAAAFVLDALVDADAGTLLHAWRGGQGHVHAFLDDYAFLVEGLLQLHAATGEPEWAEEALSLAVEQEERLGDPGFGGYFGAGEDPRLLLRAKPAFDGAVASGNGVAALNAIEIFRLTGDASWAERAESTLRAFADAMAQAPIAHVTLVRALERFRQLERPASPGRVAGDSPAAPVATAGRPPEPVAATPSLEDEAYDAVEVEGRLGSGDDEEWKPFRLELALRRGWHTNANPAGEGLAATTVAGVLGRLRNLRYPVGEPWDGGGGPVPVYRGRVAIEGEIEHRGGGAPAVELAYQACDDTRCLPPVSRIVRLK